MFTSSIHRCKATSRAKATLVITKLESARFNFFFSIYSNLKIAGTPGRRCASKSGTREHANIKNTSEHRGRATTGGCSFSSARSKEPGGTNGNIYRGCKGSKKRTHRRTNSEKEGLPFCFRDRSLGQPKFLIDRFASRLSNYPVPIKDWISIKGYVAGYAVRRIKREFLLFIYLESLVCFPDCKRDFVCLSHCELFFAR